jgi:hypothetical protein
VQHQQPVAQARLRLVQRVAHRHPHGPGHQRLDPARAQPAQARARLQRRPQPPERQPQRGAGYLDDAEGQGPAAAEGLGQADRALAADGDRLGGAFLARGQRERDHAALGKPGVGQRPAGLEQHRAGLEVDSLEVRGEAAAVVGPERGEQAIVRDVIARRGHASGAGYPLRSHSSA